MPAVLALGSTRYSVDVGETAEAVLTERLGKQTFDCVLIGAGLRAPDNPWASVYWYAALSLLGIAATLLLRLRFLPASGALAGVL